MLTNLEVDPVLPDQTPFGKTYNGAAASRYWVLPFPTGAVMRDVLRVRSYSLVGRCSTNDSGTHGRLDAVDA